MLALVGAYKDDGWKGSAYLFDCGSPPCSQVDKLTALDRADDNFGYSVHLAGVKALVGAERDDGYQGSAYLFDCASLPCSQLDRLTAMDRDGTDDFFGYSVSFSGSFALVGAAYDTIEGKWRQGSAYLFDCTSLPCSQVDMLIASDGAEQHYFGMSVSLDGTLALIGARYRGSAYLFDCASTPCSQVDRITVPNGPWSWFGHSVSLSGSLALVGAYLENIKGKNNQGSAYLFDCTSLPCSQIEKLVASDGAAGDQFGFSVSLSGQTVFVGANRDDTEGSAYFLGFFPFSFSKNRLSFAENFIFPFRFLYPEFVHCSEEIFDYAQWPTTLTGMNGIGVCLDGFSVYQDNVPRPDLRPQRLCLKDHTGRSAVWQDTSVKCERFLFFSPLTFPFSLFPFPFF